MTRKQFDIFLSPPFLSGDELQYVDEALKSNWITTEGEQVDQFEKEISTFINVPHALVTNTGTAAIHLALSVLGISRGDVVICQSFTFVATVNPVVYTGAMPVLVDSENHTWNMDPALLEEAIRDCQKVGKIPKAIIYVHVYGMPACVNEIREIASRYDIPLIEDAAEAFGSEYFGRKAGSMGDISVFSFNGNKIITTSGGGALISRDPALVERARYLSTQARGNAVYYEHKDTGFNYRLSHISAAVGRAQLRTIDERVRNKRKIFNFYKEFLVESGAFSFQEESAGALSNRWLTCLLAKDRSVRDRVLNVLTNNHIESRPLWKPMHLQPVFRDAKFFGNSCSKELFEKGLCLPSGSQLSYEDVRKISQLILSVL